MQVKVNGELVTVFSGARVKHAIMRYSRVEYEAIRKGKKVIRDAHGNRVHPGGELTGRESFSIVESHDG